LGLAIKINIKNEIMSYDYYLLKGHQIVIFLYSFRYPLAANPMVDVVAKGIKWLHGIPKSIVRYSHREHGSKF
jgi:hypothetical protein